MSHSEMFCRSFAEAYRECRPFFQGDSWSQVWNTYWNNFMLWNPPFNQGKPLLGLVADKMGLKLWEGEPFSLDRVFVPRGFKQRGKYPIPIIVAIEHENDRRTFDQEVAKLTYIRCPLKVGITYTLPILGPVSQEVVKSSQEYIKNVVVEISENLNKCVTEAPNVEYLYLLGVELRLKEVDWYVLKFTAENGPAGAVWTGL